MLTPKEQRFCELVASGSTFADAYVEAGWKPRGQAAAKTGGSRIAKKTNVQKRIAELREHQGAKSEMTRDQLRQYLIEILETPIGKVNIKHRLAQAHTKGRGGSTIKLPDKLRAAELLSRLCGWDAPQTVHVEAGDKLASLLGRIRKGNG